MVGCKRLKRSAAELGIVTLVATNNVQCWRIAQNILGLLITVTREEQTEPLTFERARQVRDVPIKHMRKHHTESDNAVPLKAVWTNSGEATGAGTLH